MYLGSKALSVSCPISARGNGAIEGKGPGMVGLCISSALVIRTGRRVWKEGCENFILCEV